MAPAWTSFCPASPPIKSKSYRMMTINDHDCDDVLRTVRAWHVNLCPLDRTSSRLAPDAGSDLEMLRSSIFNTHSQWQYCASSLSCPAKSLVVQLRSKPRRAPLRCHHSLICRQG